MDSVLKQLIGKLNEYVGGLINVAQMSDEDKTNLKTHLLAAEEILARNGEAELHEFVQAVTAALLGRF